MKGDMYLEDMLSHVYAVILAGGSGTRLWPKSRDNTPKQFLKLGGDRTLMQRTYDRILPLIPAERIIVVTNAKHVESVKAQLPEVPVGNIIAEPAQRDTAMAMAVGTLIAQQLDPEAIVINMASDHVLQDEEGYRQVMIAAVQWVQEHDHMITVGIKPNSPNVNFGYIQAAGEFSQIDGHPVMEVMTFKEKPDAATAQSFLDQGNFYWNANMYTWHSRTMMEAFAKYQPAIHGLLERIRPSVGQAEFTQVLEEVYPQAEKISIDYAISEHADNLVLIPGDFGWDDVGLWSTVYELGEKDETNSVVVRESDDKSPVLSMDSRNNLVNTNGRLVALLGVEDLIVVDSDNVLMILPRSKAAEVKNIVGTLKEQNLSDYL